MSFAAGAFSSGVRGSDQRRQFGQAQGKAAAAAAAAAANNAGDPISTIATGSTGALTTLGVNQG